MSTIYRAQRCFDNWQISYESTISMDDAIYHCHLSAFKKGDWKPRALREKWWQFWRPTEHNEIEMKIINTHKLEELK